MRVLAKKNTGNYVVTLEEEGEGYQLRVLYTGDWASGEAVEIYLEPDADDADEHVVLSWFQHRIRGDRDVAIVLSAAGYDETTNDRGRNHTVKIAVLAERVVEQFTVRPATGGVDTPAWRRSKKTL